MPAATGPYRDIRANMEQTWAMVVRPAADTFRNIPLLARLRAGRVSGAWDSAEDRDGSHEPGARTSGEKALPVARGDME